MQRNAAAGMNVKLFTPRADSSAWEGGHFGNIGVREVTELVNEFIGGSLVGCFFFYFFT